MTTKARKLPDEGSPRRHLTPQQMDRLRFALFAKAAEEMGNRVKALESIGTEQAQQCIDAIRSEWVLGDWTWRVVTVSWLWVVLFAYGQARGYDMEAKAVYRCCIACLNATHKPTDAPMTTIDSPAVVARRLELQKQLYLARKAYVTAKLSTISSANHISYLDQQYKDVLLDLSVEMFGSWLLQIGLTNHSPFCSILLRLIPYRTAHDCFIRHACRFICGWDSFFRC